MQKALTSLFGSWGAEDYSVTSNTSRRDYVWCYRADIRSMFCRRVPFRPPVQRMRYAPPGAWPARAARWMTEGPSFYSAGSRKASGSFANNLGLLSRRGDRSVPGKLEKTSLFPFCKGTSSKDKADFRSRA